MQPLLISFTTATLIPATLIPLLGSDSFLTHASTFQCILSKAALKMKVRSCHNSAQNFSMTSFSTRVKSKFFTMTHRVLLIRHLSDLIPQYFPPHSLYSYHIVLVFVNMKTRSFINFAIAVPSTYPYDTYSLSGLYSVVTISANPTLYKITSLHLNT